MRWYVSPVPFQQIRDDGQHQVRRLLLSINTGFFFPLWNSFFHIHKLQGNSKFSTYAVSYWKKIGVRFEHWNKQRSTIIYKFINVPCYFVFETTVCICGSLFLLAVMMIWLIPNNYNIIPGFKICRETKGWGREKFTNLQLIYYWFSRSNHGRWNSQNGYGQNKLWLQPINKAASWFFF